MLATDQDLVTPPVQPEPLPPVPPAPVEAPVLAQPEPEPEPEPAPAPAPSPLSGVFAEGGGGEGTGEDTGDFAGADESGESASFDMSPEAGGAIGQVAGGIIGGVVAGPFGAMFGSELGKAAGQQAAAPGPVADIAMDVEADDLSDHAATSDQAALTGDVGDAGFGSFGTDVGDAGYGSFGTDVGDAGFGSFGGDVGDAGYGDFGGDVGDAGYGGFGDAGFGGDAGGGDGGGGDGGGGCYITEAVAAQGGADNAPELETLRWFRDSVLTRTPEGRELIAQYEEAAPVIVEALASRPDGAQLLQKAFQSYIVPAVEAVRRGDRAEALRLYAEMDAELAGYAAEVELDPEMEQLLEEFSQTAAEVSHDAEISSLATGTGNDLVLPGDQVANQPASRLGRIFV